MGQVYIAETPVIAQTPVTDPPPTRSREPRRLLDTLVVQLERDRRAFLWGNAIYVAANLVLAGLVWIRPAGGVTAWLPAAVAFLGNVFYALNAEWELRWEAVWRRHMPRLDPSSEAAVVGSVLNDPGSNRLARALKWTNWGLVIAWLVVLLLTIRASGFDFSVEGLSGRLGL